MVLRRQLAEQQKAAALGRSGAADEALVFADFGIRVRLGSLDSRPLSFTNPRAGYCPSPSQALVPDLKKCA